VTAAAAPRRDGDRKVASDKPILLDRVQIAAIESYTTQSEAIPMRKTTRSLAMTLALLSPLVAGVTPASACPACKDTVAGGDTSATDTGEPGVMMGSGGLPSGFNTSVYVLLGAFLGSLGLVGYTLVRGARSGNANSTTEPLRE
jgi:hypothetical protein